MVLLLVVTEVISGVSAVLLCLVMDIACLRLSKLLCRTFILYLTSLTALSFYDDDCFVMFGVVVGFVTLLGVLVLVVPFLVIALEVSCCASMVVSLPVIVGPPSTLR